MSHRGPQSAASAMTNGVGASTGAGSAGPTTAKVKRKRARQPGEVAHGEDPCAPVPEPPSLPLEGRRGNKLLGDDVHAVFSRSLWARGVDCRRRALGPSLRAALPPYEARKRKTVRPGGTWPFEGSSQFEWCFAPADCPSPPTRRECLISPRQRARNSAKNTPLPSRRRRARPLLDVWQ